MVRIMNLRNDRCAATIGRVNRSARRVMVAVAGMAVLAMTATLAGAQTHPATFSLDDVMQAPFASDMLAAPTGAAVAWVFNAKGCSNVWAADPSHGVKRARSHRTQRTTVSLSANLPGGRCVLRSATVQAERPRSVSSSITTVLIDCHLVT